MNDAMHQLRQIEKELFGYNYAIALIMTDEATTAPTDGNAGRGEALEVLSAQVYSRIADPELPELLARAGAGELTAQQAAEVRELRRMLGQCSKVPAAGYAAGRSPSRRKRTPTRAGWISTSRG